MGEEDRIPRTIYLQWSDEDSPEGATWCVDKINDTDIEYRLAVLPGTKASHPSWGDVLRAVDNLYQCWANDDKEQTDAVRSAFNSLMQTYDDWLD